MREADAGIAVELRDGLLQDLVAVGLLLQGARCAMRQTERRDDADEFLDTASATLQTNMAQVRDLISRLRAA